MDRREREIGRMRGEGLGVFVRVVERGTLWSLLRDGEGFRFGAVERRALHHRSDTHCMHEAVTVVAASRNFDAKP